MRTLTIVQSTAFAALVLGTAAAAGLRSVPFDLPEGAAVIDGRLARAFESHYDERFPGKTLGTNLWAAIDYLVFDEGRPGVVVGRDGWLYTDEEFKTYPDAESAVATHLALISYVREELARQGTTLVVALVPSKARVYPEYLGERKPAAIHDALYGRTREALEQSGIAAPDLLRALDACKRSGAVFLRTDTHWTPEGARCVAQAVRGALPARAMNVSAAGGGWQTRITGIDRHQGDLLKFLPLDPYFKSLLPGPEPVELRQTERAGAADDLLGDAGPPTAVLVGTSYSADTKWNLTGALQEALQEDVVNYAAMGKGPFVPMLDYLLNSGDLLQAGQAPSLLVWEIPERYLPLAQDLRVAREMPASDCGKPAQHGT